MHMMPRDLHGSAGYTPILNPGTINPKPETRILAPDIRNTKHESWNPQFGFKFEARILEPETRNPKHESWNPKPKTRNTNPETPNPKHETRNTGH